MQIFHALLRRSRADTLRPGLFDLEPQSIVLHVDALGQKGAFVVLCAVWQTQQKRVLADSQEPGVKLKLVRNIVADCFGLAHTHSHTHRRHLTDSRPYGT
jgi:hypothetical protein